MWYVTEKTGNHSDPLPLLVTAFLLDGKWCALLPTFVVGRSSSDLFKNSSRAGHKRPRAQTLRQNGRICSAGVEVTRRATFRKRAARGII